MDYGEKIMYEPVMGHEFGYSVKIRKIVLWISESIESGFPVSVFSVILLDS